MRRFLAACLLLSLVCLCACGMPQPDPDPLLPTPTPGPSAPLPSPPEPVPAIPWQTVPVYYNGLLADRAYLRDTVVYFPPAALARFLELTLDTQATEEAYTLTLEGVEVQGRADRDFAMADARYLYTPGGFLTVDGEVCLPVQAAARLFGFQAQVDLHPTAPRVDLRMGSPVLMHGSGGYYESHYSAEDLYWLSHIIHAEAKGEPLAGQIGVGNVVLNRMKSPLYPGSIRDVIFEICGDVVQFDPIADGSVHLPVNESTMIAVYLCLEGFNTVGESMFFVNPVTGNPGWFDAYRSFYTRIGGHDFYT